MNQLMIKYGIDMATLAHIFKSHLEGQGIVFDSDRDFTLEKQRKRTYLRTNHSEDATKRKKKTAWYLIDVDNAKMSYGWFHAGGASFTYSLYEYIEEMNLQPGDVVYTKEQQEADLKRYLDSCRRADRAKAEQEITAIIYMGFEWSRSLDLPLKPHKYLIRKQIVNSSARVYNPKNFTKTELVNYIEQHHPSYKNSTLIINRIMEMQPLLDQQRLRENKLLVEGQNLKNQIIFLQTICEEKNKKGEDKFSLRGVIANGAFKVLFKESLKAWDRNRVIFCEGYATGEAIAEAIKYSIPVIIVYVAGNILNVVKDFRQVYPYSKFYIFHDNDLKTAKESKIKRNPGLYYASEASKVVNAYLIGPDFTEEQINFSDWNDFKCIHGVEHTRTTIRDKMKAATPIKAVQSEINPNYSINALFFKTEHILQEAGLDASSMTNQNWFTLVIKAYAQLTQEGFSQIHPIELVRERFLTILINKSKEPRYVIDEQSDHELLKLYSKLVALCTKNEPITMITAHIMLMTRAYKAAGYSEPQILSLITDALIVFFGADWSHKFLNNIFATPTC